MVIFSSHPFGSLANIQRPRANIHVRYDIYHIPLRQSLDVISHPFPFIIGYYDVSLVCVVQLRSPCMTSNSCVDVNLVYKAGAKISVY